MHYLLPNVPIRVLLCVFKFEHLIQRFRRWDEHVLDMSSYQEIIQLRTVCLRFWVNLLKLFRHLRNAEWARKKNKIKTEALFHNFANKECWLRFVYSGVAFRCEFRNSKVTAWIILQLCKSASPTNMILCGQSNVSECLSRMIELSSLVTGAKKETRQNSCIVQL